MKGPLVLRGEISLPGDKSISHRSLLFAAIAEGESLIRNLGTGADVGATRRLISLLGVDYSSENSGNLRVMGQGFNGLVQPTAAIDCGNSGTTMRLGAGLIAGRPHFAVLSGDRSLRKRPMARVIEPLRQMGAELSGAGGNQFPPLVLRGGQLTGITYSSDVASAQVKGALLLAGLQASGETVVELPAPTRDHSERMLKALGCDIQTEADRVRVGRSQPRAADFEVPGDISSATFLVAACAVCPGSEVKFRSVSVNPSRIAVLDAMKSMGVEVEVGDESRALDEPSADVTVRYSPNLRPINVSGTEAALLIDEIPVLACLAAITPGQSTFRDLAELRGKESDRIAVLGEELGRLGVKVEVFADGLSVEGGEIGSAEVRSHGDHRIAMALASLLAGCEGTSVVGEFGAVAVSYPEFGRDLGQLAGLDPRRADSLLVDYSV